MYKNLSKSLGIKYSYGNVSDTTVRFAFGHLMPVPSRSEVPCMRQSPGIDQCAAVDQKAGRLPGFMRNIISLRG